ncbi:MAG: hypothetical protein P4L75_00360 [Clostridia bacterium]|nr:hypothetical protein [Clostridia bacterium]
MSGKNDADTPAEEIEQAPKKRMSKPVKIIIIVAACVIVVAGLAALIFHTQIAALFGGGSKITNDPLAATLTINTQAVQQQAQQSGAKNYQTLLASIPRITIDQIKKYADSTYITGYSYTLTVSLNASNIKAVPRAVGGFSRPSGVSGMPNGASGMPGGNGGANSGTSSGNRGAEIRTITQQGEFELVGCSSSDKITSFKSGSDKITSGAFWAAGDTNADCVISQQLATKNSLKVGSTITFTNPKKASETYTFTVTGIYSTTTSSSNSFMSSTSENMIYTNYDAAQKVVTDSKSSTATALSATLTPIFYLKAQGNLIVFRNELYTKGLSKLYTLQTGALSAINTTGGFGGFGGNGNSGGYGRGFANSGGYGGNQQQGGAPAGN